jgi:hypothetical protein
MMSPAPAREANFYWPDCLFCDGDRRAGLPERSNAPLLVLATRGISNRRSQIQTELDFFSRLG